MSVDIRGINKVALLKALWENAKSDTLFTNYNTPPPLFDETGATKAVNKYIDYFDGRYIKTDLSGDVASPHSYDRNWGQGIFQKIVQSLK